MSIKNTDKAKISSVLSLLLATSVASSINVYAEEANGNILEGKNKLKETLIEAKSFYEEINLSFNIDKIDLSKEVLKPYISLAEIILENDVFTDGEILEAEANLRNAMVFLNSVNITTDSDIATIKIITEAREFLSEIEIGRDIGQYSIEKVKGIEELLDSGEAILNSNDKKVLPLVFKYLDTEIESFKNNANLSADKSSLIEAIAYSNNVIENEDLSDEEIAEISAQGDKARIVMADANARLIVVEKEARDLTNLVDTILGLDVKANKDSLNSKLIEAEELKDNTFSLVGYDKDQYPESAFNTFVKAIEDARLIADKDSSSQDELDEALEMLQNAIDYYRDSKVTVEKTELELLIREACDLMKDGESLPSNTYIDDAKQILEDSYNQGVYIYENVHHNQDEIDSTVSLLTESKRIYTLVVGNYDVSDLKVYEAEMRLLNRVLEIENFLKTITIGKDIGHYPEEYYELLKDEINKVYSILDVDASNISEMGLVRALSSLNDVFDGFKDTKRTTADKTDLKEKLLEGQKILNDADDEISNAGIYDFGAPGNFTEEAYNEFRLALEEGNDKYNLDVITLAEVESAVIDLDRAYITFENSRVSVSDIDKHELRNKVDEASNIYDAQIGNIGFDMGQVRPEHLEELKVKLDEAVEVLNKDYYTQEKVDTTVASLTMAITNFKNSIITANKTELKNALIQATALFESTSGGTSAGEYPFENRIALKEKMDNAKTIYETEHYNQIVIDEWVELLMNEISNYTASIIPPETESGGEEGKEVDKTPLQEKIVEANDKKAELASRGNSIYLVEFIEELDIVLNEASRALESDSITEETISSYIDAIDEKLNALVNEEKAELNRLKSELNSLIERANIVLFENNNNYNELKRDDLKSTLYACKTFADENSTSISGYKEKIKSLKTAIDEFTNETGGNLPDDETNGGGNNNGGNNNGGNNNGGNDNGGNSGNGNNGGGNNNGGSNNNGSNSESNDQELIDEMKIKIEDVLHKIRATLSVTEVGFESDNCTQNQKQAAMYMYSYIENRLEGAETLSEMITLYNLGYYTLLDFNERTISMSPEGVINGKYLTGHSFDLTEKYPHQLVESYTDFIPQAGLPIDVRTLMSTVGMSLMGVGMYFRKKDEDK